MNSLFPSRQELKEMMRPASSKATWIVFGVPLFLLLAIGILADRTTASFAQSEHWVSHTHEVQTAIESLRANVFIAQDSRKGYLLTHDDSSLAGYTTAVEQLPGLTRHLRELTVDNPEQGARLVRLQPVIQSKLSLLKESVELRRSGSADAARQAELTRQNEDLTVQLTTILDGMAEEEKTLLEQRTVISAGTYRRMRIILAIALAMVVCFLLITFARLLVELRNRMHAEAAVRRLSGRILQLQDLERRKVARELHDGVGQYFVSSKMAIDVVLHEHSWPEAQRKTLAEAVQLLEQGMAEARTLSYLLHPPLLDEVGFRAAAEWYISGFAERSKIKVKFTAPASLEAMSKDIELVLFRVLQEALTNIHRHAGSATAEVRMYSASGSVTMEIEDHGKGIPQTLLDDFRRSTGTGVGLAGMRERVHEFQGLLEISSPGRGTLLRVELRLPTPDSADATASGPPQAQTQIQLGAKDAADMGNGLLLATLPS